MLRLSPASLRPVKTVVALAALFSALLAIMPLLHQAMVLAVAASLRVAASSLVVKHVLTNAGLDPVYASVFNRTMGNIEARGLAVASPLGEALHQLLPGVFAAPERVVPGAWASALVGDGVSVLATAMVVVATNTFFLSAGLLLSVFGIRRLLSGPRLAFLAFPLLGIMLQARALTSLLRLRFSLEDLEIMGLSHLFTKITPLDSGLYRELVSGPVQGLAPYVIPAAVILTTYGSIAAVLVLRMKCRHINPRGIPALARPALNWLSPYLKVHTAHRGLAAVALVAAVSSPLFLPSRADYNYQAEAGGAYSVITQELDQLPPPLKEGDASGEAVGPGPSKVSIAGSNYAYTYSVNGHQERIRGIGYNTMYSNLSPTERAARYDWDFAEMKAAGVNTILGWEREQFDELTLEKANEYGLGVVMPFYLPGNGDYGNPSFEQAISRDADEWVKRFKQYPAVRMWGIGNEVIHYIHSPDSPRAKAFSQFLVKLADRVHAIDPDHSVIYRDAEDLYVAPVRDALQKDGVRRPWFVYGVNFFTYRICDALSEWPTKGMDVPLVISEFAASGLSPEDRPEGYLKMLRCIARQHPAVLGGFVYVWTTFGPEAIDRTMGLVDRDGQPVDRSFWAIGRAYQRLSNAPANAPPKQP